MRNILHRIAPFIVPLGLLFFLLYGVSLAYPLVLGANWPPDNHFILLAKQFLKFKVELDPLNVPRGDVAAFFDRRDVYFGPFPSILLLPIVLIFNEAIPQYFLSLAAAVLAFPLVWSLSRRFGFSPADSFWMTIFFVFSTVFFTLGITISSAGLVQAVGAVFLLLALTQYFGPRRYFLVGLFAAFAGMTRIPFYLAGVFFLTEWLSKRLTFRQLIIILLPITFSLVLLAGYNYKRFRNPFESGYQYNLTHQFSPLAENLKFGLTSWQYLPTNLYVLFIKAPMPVVDQTGSFLLKFPYLKADPWGMAIWFNSPLLLYLLTRLKKDPLTVSLTLTSAALALPSLTFFSIGYAEFGYRYALDFLPFLLILLLHSLKPKLTWGMKFLILLGAVFNVTYFTSIWNAYPLLGIQ